MAELGSGRHDGVSMRSIWYIAAGTICLALGISQGCEAGGDDVCTTSCTDNDGGGGPDGGGGNGNGGDGGSAGTTFTTGGTGGDGGEGGQIINPCGTRCGDTELCVPGLAVALDDDCDGLVDEGCACDSGAAQACFKGDPSYRNTPGCFAGSQSCSELGVWGDCNGGVHATDMCFVGSSGCHAISGVPFVTIDLDTGTGDFSLDAITESWSVTCPAGVSPCPTVQNMSDYTPLQSGEYTVTYTKTTAGGMGTCEYPLFVGAPGLRVELTWDHFIDDPVGGVDLDLHLHKPNDTTPWEATGGNATECAWDNCTADDCEGGACPVWFFGAAPPMPVEWYLDPVMEKNTCFYGPEGATWQGILDPLTGLQRGCHNPRLDIDNITCDASITDPLAPGFCSPENINIDFPPDAEWTRIGVHYWSSHGATYDVHPEVKIFCHGKLAAVLGSTGYFNDTAAVTFKPQESSLRFWMVADVAFIDDECDDSLCVVKPIYGNASLKTPHFVTTDDAQASFGPAYPPGP
jgi:hypothetical protein